MSEPETKAVVCSTVLRRIVCKDLGDGLLKDFQRKQRITRVRRKIDDTWQWVACPAIEDWTAADHARKLRQMRSLLESGGLVAGAFESGRLIGFILVTPPIPDLRCAVVSSLHVSADRRGRGIGRALFQQGVQYAVAHRLNRLYVSTSPAEETQRFYQAMGCVDASDWPVDCEAPDFGDCPMSYPL